MFDVNSRKNWRILIGCGARGTRDATSRGDATPEFFGRAKTDIDATTTIKKRYTITEKRDGRETGHNRTTPERKQKNKRSTIQIHLLFCARFSSC